VRQEVLINSYISLIFCGLSPQTGANRRTHFPPNRQSKLVCNLPRWDCNSCASDAFCSKIHTMPTTKCSNETHER